MENNLLDENDINTAEEADNIATEITKILIEAFKSKENREPTNVEIQLLIEELTEERINALLSDKTEEEVEEEEEVKEIDDDEVVDEDDEEKNENIITNKDDEVIDEETIDKTIIEKIYTDDLKENVKETKTPVESSNKRSSLDNEIDFVTLATTEDSHLTILKDNINYNTDELHTKKCKIENI